MSTLQDPRREDEAGGEPPGTSSDRPLSLAVVVVGLVGVVLRVVNARQDLFADELATYWVVADHGFAEMLRTVASTAEITPPLSFVLSWLTTRPEASPELVRLPAVLAGISTLPLVWSLGRRTVGRSAAHVATALTALSPFMILYSTEARGYGVLMLLVLGSTFALLRGIETGGVRWWAAYAACACLAMYTHYTSVFVLAVQAGWALWHHSTARRALVLATIAAAVLYVPWLPSLKGDLESPTTDILSDLSPLSVDMVRATLGHWSVGYPYNVPTTTLLDLPGLVPLLAMGAGMLLGLQGLVTRGRLARGAPAPSDPPGAGLDLMAMLAVATPLGTLAQSAVGTNVFSVRSLAASWPYLALVAGGVIVAAAPRLRAVAVALVVGSMAVGAITMLGSDFQRPNYTELVRFADAHGAAVVINGASFSPGPLTQLEVEGSIPEAPVLRLDMPERMDRPFGVGDQPADPVTVFSRAARIADGGPIVVLWLDGHQERISDLIATLPGGYAVTAEMSSQAFAPFHLRAQVLERDGR